MDSESLWAALQSWRVQTVSEGSPSPQASSLRFIPGREGCSFSNSERGSSGILICLERQEMILLITIVLSINLYEALSFDFLLICYEPAAYEQHIDFY